MLKKISAKVKNHIKNLHNEDSGMELIQVVLIILIGVVLGVMVMKLGQGLFNRTENKIDESFTF